MCGYVFQSLSYHVAACHGPTASDSISGLRDSTLNRKPSPRGSQCPIFKDSGSKKTNICIYIYNIYRDAHIYIYIHPSIVGGQRPEMLGTWTLWVTLTSTRATLRTPLYHPGTALRLTDPRSLRLPGFLGTLGCR